MTSIYRSIGLIFIFLLVASCEPKNFSELTKQPSDIAGMVKRMIQSDSKPETITIDPPPSDPANVLADLQSQVDFRNGFKQAMLSAINTDPEVLMLQKDLLAQESAIEVAQSQKEFH